MNDFSTIAALATPVGSSALALIRVSGNLAVRIVESAFENHEIISRKAYFGRYKSCKGKILDECVWTLFPKPGSYTGEDLLEISCHGNPFIVNRILEDLFRRGCCPARPGEFTKRAFLNGKMDLTQAEAVAEIISAQSERSFEAARKLLSGELGKRIFTWNEEILMLLAETETQIDFSEEEVPEIDSEYFKKRVGDLILSLRETKATARYSSRVYEGINVVIFGAPNAGKSSLMNALIGSERALVSDEAGTTRDFISENILIGENCIRIVDTAGIRDDAVSKVEKSGIEKTLDCISGADFLVFVVDASSPPPSLSKEILEKINPENTCILFNKADKPQAFDKNGFLPEIDNMSISLLRKDSGEAIKDFLAEIFRKKNVVPDGNVLIVSTRHAEAISRAENQLMEASEIIGNLPVEFVSAKLRAALEELSEILGQFDNEKVLDKIFSSFCIGK
ncbi:MAG: tRNA uridine-5-carboxymethylaminomethyl(34) synthesis GTPase MnmE [Verrucomicrobia bacterium]|nr:tRNA uridine-5-carboxymethylaminomethyl(34) synthesis GTPase MnmE [Verrucomicrobiota bacterium]